MRNNDGHEHTNGEQCGCGHHHHEHHAHGEHDGHCGCGCGHAHKEVAPLEGVTAVQQDVLLALCQRKCLPVACFALTNTSDDAYAIALAPVYLNGPEDSMEQVKWLGAELVQLEEAGLITLDYDIRLKEYAYEEYEKADVYKYFVQTVREAAQIPGHVFDTPVLELGSMALTEAGQKMVDKMLD